LVIGMFMLAALGGEVDLEIERGRADLASERIAEARVHALTSLADDLGHAEAQHLYADVMVAGGLGSQGVVETAGLVAEPWIYERAVERVREALRDEDPKEAALAARAIRERWPDRPDLGAVLWEAELPGGRLARERSRHLLQVRAALQGDPDPLYAYRAYRLMVTVGADPSQAAEVLAQLGEDVVVARPPLTRFERSELARAEALKAEPVVPEARPADALDLAERIGQNLLVEGRVEDAAAMWSAFRQERDSAEAATAHAGVLLEGEAFEEALKVADHALSLAVEPTDRDLAARDQDELRARLVDASWMRARALEGAGELPSALVALRLASMLRGAPVDEGMEKRLRLRTVSTADGLRSRYGGAVPASRALRRAEVAAEADPEAAEMALGDALFLYALVAKPTAEEWAGPYRLVAQWLVSKGAARDARVAAAVVVNLVGDADSWATQAALQEEAGFQSAAFASWASARAAAPAESTVDYSSALQRTYAGPGDWEAAAVAVAKSPPTPDTPAETGGVYPQGLSAVKRRGGGGSPGQGGGTKPAIGEKMPAWSIRTATGGVISGDELVGRTVVLTFWASYCDVCLQMLPELSAVTTGLRREGSDVVVMAVSVDTDPGDYENARRLGQHWGQLAREPDLAVKLGVTSLPATWVVDGQGNVRYFQDSWPGPHLFERELRQRIKD